MFSFLARHPPRTRIVHLSKIEFDNGRSFIQFKPHDDRYLVINSLPPDENQASPADEKPTPPNCALAPPLHWHSHQEEVFHVLEGDALFYLEGKRQVARQGDVVTIPKQAFHTFRNASATQRLLIEFVLKPQNKDRDECFFRNTQTYRDDCRKAGVPRSMFQVLMFNRRGNVVLALPGPKPVAKLAGLLLNFLGSIIGRYFLGYSYSYPEYYDPKH